MDNKTVEVKKKPVEIKTPTEPKKTIDEQIKIVEELNEQIKNQASKPVIKVEKKKRVKKSRVMTLYLY